MYQVKIEVVKLQLSKCLLQCRTDSFWGQVSAPTRKAESNVMFAVQHFAQD